VIDEIHTLVGAGAAEGAVDAANILKPALTRKIPLYWSNNK
jgi:ATP-dependent Clp protease ATP-binding subunit ClpC